MSAPVPNTRNGGLPFAYVAAGLVVLMLVALGGGYYVFHNYVAYERIAAYHIPADSTFAVRADIEKLRLFEPIGQHVFPTLDDVHVAEANRAALRKERGKHQQLGRDLREIVWAIGPGDEWILIVSGKFPKHGVVSKLATLFQERKVSAVFDQPSDVLELANGRSIGQADDGAVVVASSRARLSAALRRSDAYRTLGLEADGPGSFGVRSAFFESTLVSACGENISLPPGLERVAQVSGTLRVADAVNADALAASKPGSPDIAQSLRAFLALLGRLAPTKAVAAPFERAELHADGAGGVRVHGEWRGAELDQLATWGAESLRDALGVR